MQSIIDFFTFKKADKNESEIEANGSERTEIKTDFDDEDEDEGFFASMSKRLFGSKPKQIQEEFPPLDTGLRSTNLHWSWDPRNLNESMSGSENTSSASVKLPYVTALSLPDESKDEPPPKPSLDFL